MIDLSSSCDALTKAPTTCALSFPAKIPLGPPPSSRLDEFPLDDTAGSRGERRKGKAYGLLPQCRFVIRDNVTNVTSSLPSLSSPEIEMLLAHSAFEIGSRRGLRLFATSFRDVHATEINAFVILVLCRSVVILNHPTIAKVIT